MIHYEYDRSINSSGGVFVFWLLQLICNSVLVYSALGVLKKERYLHHDTNLRSSVLFSGYMLILIQFLLHLIPDNKCLSEKELYGERQPDVGAEWLQTDGRENEVRAASAQINEGRYQYISTIGIRESLSTSRESASPRRRLTPFPELLSSFLGKITFTWLTG